MPKQKGYTRTDNRKNYDEACRLYEMGLSIADVAKHYGVSRQGMYDILRRRGTKMRPNTRVGPANHFYRGGSLASDRAQNTLEKAIQKGIVEKKLVCEICGKAPVMRDGRSGVQAHHPDYNRPLTVMWLCQPCHHKWHKENRAIPDERVFASDAQEEQLANA